MDKLTLDDIDGNIKSKIYFQKYNKKEEIQGVKLVKLHDHINEDGNFTEVLKFTESGELSDFPGFKIRQVNRSSIIPGTVKAWHIHFKQNEVWYVSPNSRLFVALWDLRKNSITNGEVMRLTLGGGQSYLLFIPKGVAHGNCNFHKKNAEMWYFCDAVFDAVSPDEGRINWDALGVNFWKPVRD